MAEALTTWSLPAETKEFIPITVTANGLNVPNFEVAFTQGAARPVTWVAADEVDGSKGILVGAGVTGRALVVGQKYTAWVRFTDTPEVPVTRACYVKAT
jgi:hypothetical protein